MILSVFWGGGAEHPNVFKTPNIFSVQQDPPRNISCSIYIISMHTVLDPDLPKMKASQLKHPKPRPNGNPHFIRPKKHLQYYQLVEHMWILLA